MAFCYSTLEERRYMENTARGTAERRWQLPGAVLAAVLLLLLPSIGFTQSPSSVALAQNYPNPFNPSTTIQYTIAEAGMVTLKLFNILGVEVATLVNGRQEAGSYAVRINAGGDTPGFTSGVYFYRLETRSLRSTRKMVLLD